MAALVEFTLRSKGGGIEMPKGMTFVFGQVPFGDVVRDQTHNTANLPFGKIAHLPHQEWTLRIRSSSLEMAPLLARAYSVSLGHALDHESIFRRKKLRNEPVKVLKTLNRWLKSNQNKPNRPSPSKRLPSKKAGSTGLRRASNLRFVPWRHRREVH
jgi:hypothetical protein